MADGSNIVKYGLLAGGAWLLYEWWAGRAPSENASVLATVAPGAAAAGSGGAAAPPAPPPPPAAPASPPAVAFNSLDSIFARLSAAVGSQNLTADQFNYYLARQLPAGVAPPDPLAVFNASGNWDRTIPMTIANYWGAMAPYLRANLGLSGLGFFGGLGALTRGRGR